MFKKLCLILISLFVVGCSSSPYQYYEEPTSITQGVTKYNLGDVKINLTLGHGAIDGDMTFASQEKLTQEFKKGLIKYLMEKGIYSTDNSNPFVVNITIDYKRTFNYGGKALSKPEVSHVVNVEKSDKKVASFSQDKYTTKYGTFDEMAVNMKIAAFQWDEDNEPEDVDLVSKMIIDDLADLGD